ncbi:uncharacterized protein RHO25_003870 [Cercospora beticola]|uniref:Myb-like domain-containing protein n=1 Tax=Cercospora beticola TaxID=122368 RepID=A0ABZ0NID4_CERBT|nr:hypothetical protein RHO25_003870 [Cercospora beticola]
MAKAYSATAPGETTAAPPPTTRRTTRSQSAEPQQIEKTNAGTAKNGEDASNTSAKRGARQTKTKDVVEGTLVVASGFELIGSRPPSAVVPRSEYALTAAPELPTVDENSLFVGEDADADAEAEEDVDARLDEQLNGSPRRNSIGSAFSGTTAKTSFSQDEINKLDHEVICDVLPDILSAAERLTQLLVPNGANTPPETWKEIKRSGSKHNKLFTTRWESLRIHKPSLTSVEYIEPRYVLRALLNVASMAEVQPAAWRPDNVLYKINMALMLRTVLVQCDPADWTEEATGALESLDMAFPACIAGGEFKFAALDLWLELAAHVTIHRLEAAIESEPNFSAHEEIDNVFYDADSEFKHAKTLGLASANQEDFARAMEMVNQRISVLKEPFGQDDGKDATAANGYLKAQFRWDDFRSHALRYFDARIAEVNNRIEAAGGVQTIVSGLEQEVERRASEKIAEQMKGTYKKPGTPRQSLGGKSAIALLKGHEKRLSDQVPAAGAPAPVASMYPTNDTLQDSDVITHDFATGQRSEVDQDSLEGPTEVQSTAQQALASFAATQKQNARKAKARLLDRQENAVRVSSEMYMDSQTQASAATGKRSRAQMEEEVPEDFDPTQDDGFENDTRNHNDAAQRRAEVAFQERAPQRFPTIERRSDADVGPSTHEWISGTAPSPSKRQRKNPGSAIPPPRPAPAPEDGELPMSEFYKQAKLDAKYNRVLAPAAPVRTERTPWSDEEEAALIDLIVDHVADDEKIGYSNLKAIDQSLEESGEAKLSRRSAEDIRFKARNMKLTLLLAERKLPRNWDKVILDKKAIDRLAQRGIPYDQGRSRAAARVNNPLGQARPRASVTPSHTPVYSHSPGVRYESGGIL